VVASFVAYVLRVNLSIVGPSMIDELGISTVQLGTILSAFALGYTIFQFPGGIFGDRVGPRLAVTLMALAWGLLTLASGLVPQSTLVSTAGIVAILVAVRFVMGLVQAPIFPVMTGGMVSSWFPVAGWGLPNGLSSTGLTLGGAATGPLIVWLTATVGWRGSFLVTAPVALLLAGVWWGSTRDHPRQHPGVAPRELALIEAGKPPLQGAVPEKGAWKQVLANRDVLLLTLSYFCENYVFYLFFNWFFYYLEDVRGFAAGSAGWLSSAQWILGAVGATLGGLSCDGLMRRFGLRRGARILPVAGLLASGGFLVAGAVAPDPVVAAVLLAASFGFTQVTEAAFWAATIAVAGRHASAAAGVLNTGGNLPGVVGGILVPMLASALGWTWAVASGGAVAVVGAVLWFWIRADQAMEGE
jgi:ACS family glucarate transporter-like MFS transporter